MMPMLMVVDDDNDGGGDDGRNLLNIKVTNSIELSRVTLTPIPTPTKSIHNPTSTTTYLSDRQPSMMHRDWILC